VQLEGLDEYLCPGLARAFDYPRFEQLNIAASTDPALFEPDLQVLGPASFWRYRSTVNPCVSVTSFGCTLACLDINI
jgi:hypothetical protein